MKKILVALLMLVLLTSFVSAEEGDKLTMEELKAKLSNPGSFNEVKDQLNDGLKDLPGFAKSMIGTDRVYYVRLSSYEYTMVMENGEITSVTYGKPDKPTHMMSAFLSVILDLANADNTFSELASAIAANRIRIEAIPACSTDTQCADDQVCISSECKDAFTVAVVPIAYSASEGSKFKSDAAPEIGLMEKYLPINEDYLRIHYVDPAICPNNNCRDVCRDCQDSARTCAGKAGLLGVADNIVGVSRDHVQVYINGQPMLLCGCAGGIPSLTSISRSRLYADGGVYCYNTVTHEVGHTLGLYHVDATGEEAGACQGPNAADCNEPDKKTDIMGYDWPQNHFGPAANNYLKTMFRKFQG